ncbi:MAG TPA: hypothetical protein VM600_06735 [Actinomycetota bacterium]|nr:hypothetical protein [Actinomycetota bacterium]
MSAYQFEHERKTVVARAATQAEAELIKMTLAAHGYQAFIAPASSVFPSVDFVEGRGILVQLENEGAARAILKSVGMSTYPPETS